MLHATHCYGAGIGHVAKVEEFEVANVESLRLGRDADKIACTVDPAGYFWEVLERHERNVTEALCKVLLHCVQSAYLRKSMREHIWFGDALCGLFRIGKSAGQICQMQYTGLCSWGQLVLLNLAWLDGCMVRLMLHTCCCQ